MGKEIVTAAQRVAEELNVPEDMIFQAMESALETATKRLFRGDESDYVEVRVLIDRETGEYETFRRWQVVDPALLVDTNEEPRELQELRELTLEEAHKKDAKLQLGDWHEEQIVNSSFGHIEAQTAKQVIREKIRDAEKSKIAERYVSKVGHLMNGTVKKITRDSIILELSDNAEALLPRNKLIGREIFHVGNVVRAVLENIDAEAHGPTLQMSRSSVEMMTELFKIEVPEISEHVIELRAAAREPGQRAKIAVKTNDGRIDPVGACVGMRGARVNAVARELNEEKIDILLWDNDPAELVINAMSPAEIEDIEMDEGKGVMNIVVPERFLAQAIGRGGQNVRLTSILSGWDINVISSEDHATRKEHGKKTFMDALEIPEEKAEKLLKQGIDSMETLAYLEEDSLRTVEGIPVEEMRQLQEQASDALLMQVLSGEDGEALDEQLLSLEGMDEDLASQLAEHGVASLHDLAESAVYELLELEIPELEEERAGTLIMGARAAVEEEDAEAPQEEAPQEEDAEALKAEAPKEEDTAVLKTEALKEEALQEEDTEVLKPKAPKKKVLQEEDTEVLKPKAPKKKVLQEEDTAVLKPKAPKKKALKEESAAVLKPKAPKKEALKKEGAAALKPKAPKKEALKKEGAKELKPKAPKKEALKKEGAAALKPKAPKKKALKEEGAKELKPKAPKKEALKKEGAKELKPKAPKKEALKKEGAAALKPKAPKKEALKKEGAAVLKPKAPKKEALKKESAAVLKPKAPKKKALKKESAKELKPKAPKKEALKKEGAKELKPKAPKKKTLKKEGAAVLKAKAPKKEALQEEGALS